MNQTHQQQQQQQQFAATAPIPTSGSAGNKRKRASTLISSSEFQGVQPFPLPPQQQSSSSSSFAVNRTTNRLYPASLSIPSLPIPSTYSSNSAESQSLLGRAPKMPRRETPLQRPDDVPASFLDNFDLHLNCSGMMTRSRKRELARLQHMPDNSGRSDIPGCCLLSGISRNKSAPSFSVTLPKDILAAAGITQAPPPLPLLSSSNLPSSSLAGISTAKMAISVSQPATPTSSRRAADLTTPGSHQRVLRRTPSYNYDRFIPTRTADLMAEYYTIDRAREHSALNSPTKLHFRATGANSRYDAQKEDANRTYEALLRSELLKDEATVAVELKSMDMLPSMNGSDDNPLGTPTTTTANTGKSNNNGESRTPQTLRRTKSSLFQFRTPTSESRRKKISILSPYNNSNSNNGNNIVNSEPVALSTPSAVQTMTMISPTATRFGGNNKSSSSSNPGNSGLNQVSLKLLTPKKSRWQIPTTASMVLDAPEIINDFYLNVLDWSPTTNQLAVALFDTVYLWDPETRLTRKLCSVASGNWVTSIQWMRRPNLGDMLAVGTKAGHIDLWDLHSGQLVRTLNGCHRKRVTSLSWFDSVISSGSRDKTICHQDTRIGGRRTSAVVATYHGHTQEVCGLAWNPDINLLASGSNDNLVKIWDRRFHVGGGRRGQRRRTVSQPDLLHGGDNGGDNYYDNSINNVTEVGESLYTFAEHKAAIKALAWSPRQRGLLATGGGATDQRLRFWNAQTGRLLRTVDTKSQVCNIAWSTDGTQLVTTHGYTDNLVVVWKYNTMQPLVRLKGHRERVLYLAVSPNGQDIVTGSADETLRFWRVFPPKSGGSGNGGNSNGVGETTTTAAAPAAGGSGAVSLSNTEASMTTVRDSSVGDSTISGNVERLLISSPSSSSSLPQATTTATRVIRRTPSRSMLGLNENPLWTSLLSLPQSAATPSSVGGGGRHRGGLSGLNASASTTAVLGTDHYAIDGIMLGQNAYIR